MIHSEIKSQTSDELCRNNNIFSKYMKDQIHEIQQFLRSAPSESDKNEMAIIWIEKNADQFRNSWKINY